MFNWFNRALTTDLFVLCSPLFQPATASGRRWCLLPWAGLPWAWPRCSVAPRVSRGRRCCLTAFPLPTCPPRRRARPCRPSRLRRPERRSGLHEDASRSFEKAADGLRACRSAQVRLAEAAWNTCDPEKVALACE